MLKSDLHLRIQQLVCVQIRQRHFQIFYIKRNAIEFARAWVTCFMFATVVTSQRKVNLLHFLTARFSHTFVKNQIRLIDTSLAP